MVRRASTGAAAPAALRDAMIAHYEELIRGRAWAKHLYGKYLDRLRDGLPVVLAGWQLRRFDVAAVRPGVHAYYRVEPDGRVVEVAPRRDPADPLTITGWDVVAR